MNGKSPRSNVSRLCKDQRTLTGNKDRTVSSNDIIFWTTSVLRVKVTVVPRSIGAPANVADPPRRVSDTAKSRRYPSVPRRAACAPSRARDAGRVHEHLSADLKEWAI